MNTRLDTRPTSDDPYNDHEFRVVHGRYGSTWYCDPLPTCPVADADETHRVSVSIVKKASGSDWSNVAIKRIAAVLETDPGRFAGLDAVEMATEMRKINDEGLKGAGQRGTNVHTIAEQLLMGVPVTVTDDMAGGEYRSAVEAFFEQYDPTPVLMEFVCFNRTLNGYGFGGTADAIVEIKGKRYLVDWKSRSEDSRHSCYAQEAAQVGGYSLAEYIVVDRERRLLPDLDGALIVSIKPDGFAVYPVDLPKAQAHFVDLHAWWVSRQTEHDTYGRMWPKSKKSKIAPSKADASEGEQGAPSTVHAAADVEQSAGSEVAAPPDPALELANDIADWGGPLKALLADEWPSGVPTPAKVRKGEATWTPEQLVRAQAAVNEIVGPFDDPPVPPVGRRESHPEAPLTPAVDDGPVVADNFLDELLASIKNSPVRLVVNGWLHEASDAGVSWQPRTTRRLRQVEITRAAFHLASIIVDKPDDATDETFVETVRVVLSVAMGSDDPLMPVNPIGVALAALTIDEARRAADLSQSVREHGITFTDQGRVVLAA